MEVPQLGPPPGAFLGPAWGSLGPSWGRLEVPEAHRKRKGENATNIDFPLAFEGSWHVGGRRAGLEGHLDPSGAVLGPLG
eukprot:3763726-Pyramimonas_sp.AAC.1